MKSTSLLVALLLSACGNDPSSSPARAPRQAAPSGSNQTDERDIRKDLEYLGTTTVTQDTWLLRRKTDYQNYARVHHGSNPTQGDLDTWESRQKEGRVLPVPQGTRVKVRTVSRVSRLKSGKLVRFRRVYIDDGSILDENGDPEFGLVPEAHLGKFR